MAPELEAVVGFGLGAGAALALTPVAIRIASQLGFCDRPRDYRQHAAATPFLGGAAVLGAFLLAAVIVGGLSDSRWVLLVGAVAMWAIGTVDDLVAVAPGWRLVSEVAVASALFAAGLGWGGFGGAGPLSYVLSVLWIVGLVNAFNLMDNLDGACATVAGVSALGIGTLAVIGGEAACAGMAFALAASCAAFLRFNLAGPARIFLGDGGSMPIGFLVAGLGMATSRGLLIGDAGLLAMALTAGAVILDTTLVSVSRIRRGVSIATGGRDHLTHRLLARLRSPRRVAVALGLVQALLCGMAVAGDRIGSAAVVVFAVVVVVAGAAAIAVLDSSGWRPKGDAGDAPTSTSRPRPRAPQLTPVGSDLP